MSFLLSIATATPEFRHSQEDVCSFYSKLSAAGDQSAARKIRVIAGKSGVEARYSVIGDFSENRGDATLFESDGEPSLPGLNARMRIFRKEALKLSLKAVEGLEDFSALKKNITHIITVTCTGLYAPGLDVELVRDLQLKDTVQRSSVNFMGCNAAVLAFRQAYQITTTDPSALVLIVCTEICTIHFQDDTSDDYLLSNLLFADGSSAALVSGKSREKGALEIGGFFSKILHQGEKDMAWRLSERGFIMSLSSYVPALLMLNFGAYLNETGIDRSTITHWAVHPGGKKILDSVQRSLSLDEQYLKYSFDILKRYGNMSSVSLMFVLNEIISQPLKSNDRIFAVAFGPGITIESFILQYVS
jgi:predicted naringenin-chalcone synthase